MIRNYFKIAWRNIKKDTFFSFLNIIGLGFGIAMSLLIVQFLHSEWYVDKHHTDFEQLYQINTGFDFGQGEKIYAMAPSPLANKLLTDYPEVENATRLLLPPGVNKYLLKNGEISFFESKGVFADSTFFNMFYYPFVEGSAKTAIKQPNDIVISETLSQKLFKGEPALGKILEVNTLWGDETYQISGVVKTNSNRSHVDYELFINLESGAIGNRFFNLDEWAGNNLFYTYIKLNPEADIYGLENKFPALIESTAGERLKNLGFSKSHTLIPVKDIYLKSNASNKQGPVGNITFFYIFAAIGFFILLIACINFMNLTTAKSSIRGKEVAVKKVLGAHRSILAFQFFTETFIYVFLSLFVAVIFIYFGQIYLQNQIGLQLNSFNWLDLEMGLWVASILLFTVLLAGSYPAFMLSSFKPISIFNGRFGNHFSAAQIRKSLVIIQFVISIILIQGVLVVKEQMDYIKNEDLGYSKNEKIILPLNTQNASSKAESLKQNLKSITAVTNAGITSTHPGIRSLEDMLVFGEQKTQEESDHIDLNWIDPDFIPTMGFELLIGRNFKPGDSAYTIVTESALEGLGYTLDNALNKEVKWNWDIERSRRIIGVIKDYHSTSLKNLIQPQMFMLSDGDSQGFLVASLQSSDHSKTILDVQKAWQVVNAGEPFEFYFMNDKVQKAYESDQRMSSLIVLFTFLAILISCLGLIGLSAFAADRRKKEIGVRKVLGASVSTIVQILSKEFILLVIIAICIATPIAWHFTNQWLGTFHYSIEMPWVVYILAGIMAVLICMFTISYQAIKAARANPIESLGAE